jgi:hypothetical protein
LLKSHLQNSHSLASFATRLRYFAAGDISVGFGRIESVYLVAFLTFAQRAVWAAAILARASGETVLFLKGAALGLPVPL